MNGDNHSTIKEVGFSLLAEGKTVRIRADGYSMFPSIKPGSVIYIEPLTDEQNPAPGDIIAWKRETGFVVHRLIRILREENNIRFITRGDSSVNEDKPVLKEQIAGKVIHTESSSGKRKEARIKHISKPGYLYNRLLVWFIIRLYKLSRIIRQI